MVMQIRRTATVDHAPSGLAEGQLAVEMASDPPKLWVGVPATIDPSGRILVSPQGGQGGAVISTTAPSNPNPGDLWFDSERAQLYIWFNDGNSSQWVVTVNQASGGGGVAHPVQLSFIIPGKPPASQQYLLPITMPLKLQTTANNAVAWGIVAAASVTFQLILGHGGYFQGMSNLGTVTVTPPNTVSWVGCVTGAPYPEQLNPGNTLMLVAPDSQDATFADIGIALLAERV